MWGLKSALTVKHVIDDLRRSVRGQPKTLRGWLIKYCRQRLVRMYSNWKHCFHYGLMWKRIDKSTTLSASNQVQQTVTFNKRTSFHVLLLSIWKPKYFILILASVSSRVAESTDYFIRSLSRASRIIFFSFSEHHKNSEINSINFSFYQILSCISLNIFFIVTIFRLA